MYRFGLSKIIIAWEAILRRRSWLLLSDYLPIERNLISQRTKEALARKKAEGVLLGRPKGSKSKVNKLTGRESEVKRLLEMNMTKSAIAKVMGVHRSTISKYLSEGKIG